MAFETTCPQSGSALGTADVEYVWLVAQRLAPFACAFSGWHVCGACMARIGLSWEWSKPSFNQNRVLLVIDGNAPCVRPVGWCVGVAIGSHTASVGYNAHFTCHFFVG